MDPDHFGSLSEHLPEAWSDIHGSGKSRGRKCGDSAPALGQALVTSRYRPPEPTNAVTPSPAMLAMVRSGQTIRVRHASQIQSLAAAIRTIEQEKAGG